MENLQQRFIAHWAERGFVRNKQTVLLALSGGLDSMVLAHLLIAANIPFAAAHCNFSLRGAASDEDARFVKEWCLANGIVCHQTVFDTTKIAAENRQSIQVAARELRYEWFHVLLWEHNYASVLTAHHGDDVAETMLINLCRGTGIAGLHGIPEQHEKLIRPLLLATRNDIAAYAAANKIAWREDASNAKTDYLRNAIRHEILPRLELLMPGASSRIAGAAKRIGETEIIYHEALKKRLDKLLQQRGRDWYVPVKLLVKQEALNALAYELFTPFGFSPEQIPQALRLMQSESGRSLSSDTHRIIRHRDFLIITRLEALQTDLILVNEVPAGIETSTGKYTFSWEMPSAIYPENENTAMLNGDSIVLPLVLRTRREGDYFYPLGMGMKKKKLKRFLIDLKIAVHEKDQIRILECDRKIIWITGKRIDERFKIMPATLKILKVVFEPNSA